MNKLLRLIPPVHELQNESRLTKVQEVCNLSDDRFTIIIRDVIDEVRRQILSQELAVTTDLKLEIMKRIEYKTLQWNQDNLTRVINATGTVLHTNLGRARLSNEAIAQMVNIAKHYSNLEYNIERGERGSRHDIVEELLKELTGAEGAIIVNNNAAAVYFVLRCFAKNREVIVSRGELVEIGGSFRVSSIMSESDARLVEIGTTNKTHLYDYRAAINEQTAMILKVHTSNFKMVGFTKSVDRNDLVKLANDHKKVYYEDLGSGVMYDFAKHDIGNEPLIKTVIQNGAHLVSFSGDKLLGGPQAGIIVGRKELIDKLKSHQLARVLRVDKFTLAGLESTLKAYARNTIESLQTIPVIRDTLKPLDEIYQQARIFIDKIQSLNTFNIELKKDTSMIGGGTMPDVKLETYGVMITSKILSAAELERKLRTNELPIIGRVIKDHIYLDFRTIDEAEIDEMYTIFKNIDHQLHIV